MKTKAVRIYGVNDLRLEEFELPQIKDDEIEERPVVGRKEGFAVGEMAHGETVVRKPFAKQAGEFGVVVDDTDMR